MEKSTYVDVFIEEAKENLQVVNSTLLSLEEVGFDEASMNNAFRALHTIKGTASVVGVEPVAEITHVLEDLADQLRKKQGSPSKEVMDVLFKGTDMIEKMIDQLEKDGEIKISTKKLVAQVKKCLATMGGEDIILDDGPTEFSADAVQKAQIEKANGISVLELEVFFEDNLQLKEARAFQSERLLSTKGKVLYVLPALDKIDEKTKSFKVLLASGADPKEITSELMMITGITDVAISPWEIEAGSAEAEGADTEEQCSKVKEEKATISTGSTIRVKSKLLDQLLNLVGEIMINNIRINMISSNLKSRELKQTLQNNARLMGELQDTVLRTRMVPVDFIFKRFPRIVRDMSASTGKDIEFIMKGNDIEIDRGLLDEIGDALVHLLRNAADHGIESKEGRIAAGKSPTGKVTLSAFQEQSNVVITVEDDGKGIDPAVLKKKALQKGLITEEDAAKMDERAAINLIFMAGFSTAEKVTDISGRGVGMDVVVNKVDSMGGFIRVDSEVGKGTKMTLKLPPSMSIIRAMLVEVNRETYAIPLENVRETVKVPLDEIYEIANNGVFRLREEIMPVMNVQLEFGKSMEEGTKDMPAIIVEKNDSRACLLVSRLIGQQEIVVKTLSKDLRINGFFSGATILGDGKVAMILDVGAFI
ncbi:MAG: chemotaxis protein CheA [Methanomassiliicoccales archaeon]|nr:chemotaxis protein CheA [Methanomassiliicoccales archaeon]